MNLSTRKVLLNKRKKTFHASGSVTYGVIPGYRNGKGFIWTMLNDNWWYDNGEKGAWHISTSAFLKEENWKSRLVARMLPEPGPPFTTGAIGGGSSASATAILRFVSPQRQTTRNNVQWRRNHYENILFPVEVSQKIRFFITSWFSVNWSRKKVLPILNHLWIIGNNIYIHK